MNDGAVVYVDIETNGGTGAHGRIIEVAAIKVLDSEIVDSFVSFVNPGGGIPYWITKLTGIEESDVSGAPYFDEIARQLYAFMDGALFVAHNVMFDYSFLKREFSAAGFTFTPKLFCTVRLSRALYPAAKGHSLEKIIARHGIAVSARHRAYDDAKALIDFVAIATEEHGPDAVAANVQLQSKTRSLPSHVDEAVISELPTTPGVYIFEDDAGLPLYVGKSVNIRARVRSHFTSATTIAKELKMSLQSHNVSYLQTDTEIEALLLESAKVKELQPIFNKRLRKKTMQSVLVREQNDEGYLTFTVVNTDLGQYQQLEDVYGVFTTKLQAKTTLESLARTYRLCPKLLNLEKTTGSCFRYQLGLCKGACIGKESPERYNARVELALQSSKLESWPFKGEISVRISEARSLIVDQWVITKLVDHTFDPVIESVDNGFDLDTYKILRSFIRKHPDAVQRAA